MKIESKLLLDDFDGDHFVALPNCVDDVLPLEDLAEDGVFAVEPIGCDVGNEKLTAVGVRAGVRHGQGADLMFVRIVFYFVLEPVTRAAAAGPGRIAALDHEVGNHAMEDRAVVKFFAREKNEIVDRFRRVFGKEIAHDFPARGLERGGVLLVWIDRHRGRRGIFLGHGKGK